jgi:hypothetical protein
VVNVEDKPGAATRHRSVLFDPVLGATLFSEIQAEGLRAASSLVERLVNLVDGSHAPADGDHTANSAHEPAPPEGTELGPILQWC